MSIVFLSTLAISFFLGSIPFGKIVGRFKGLDIQQKGSGNIGFANSLRVMGWGSGLIVLASDILKGFIPTLYSLYTLSLNQTFIIATAAVAGHIFSPWLKFRGGKGVATVVGASLAINPLIALIGMLVWAIVFIFDKTASASSLLMIALMPILAIFFEPSLVYFYLFLLIVILLTHRTNITKLLKGTEGKIL